MLNAYKYIAFDFETTGLDVNKDEIIQIGIVQFDQEGNIIDTYSSLIKPQKSLTQLKGIVRFLTGFSLDDLEHAPSFEHIIPEISRFFTEDTVVIGHNISFDVAFLNKHITFQPTLQIDTFPLSKQVLPYLPSYALDVIHARLVKNNRIQPVAQGDNAHDALHDSYMAYDIFMHHIRHIHTIRHKYMIVDYLIQHNEGMFHALIQRTEKSYDFSSKKLFLPSLKSTSLNQKKVLSLVPFDLPNESINYIDASNQNIKSLIQGINRHEKRRIITSTHKSKLSIIQNILNELHYSHGTFHDQVVFDEDRVNLFLHKTTFSDQEIGFIIKYFSHHLQGDATMDINSSDEYRIFYALTTRKEKGRKAITLATHQQVRNYQEKVNHDDAILFLDHNRRGQSFKNHLEEPLDPYYLLNYLEQLTYLYELLDDSEINGILEQFQQQFTLFLGIFSSEVNQYFVGYAESRRDIDFIVSDPRFPKTRNSFPRITEAILTLKSVLPHEEFDRIGIFFTKFEEYLNDQCIVEKKMYSGDHRYYVLHQREIYNDYEEFTQSLPSAQFYMIRNNAPQQSGFKQPFSLPPHTLQRKLPLLHTITKPTAVVSHILSNPLNAHIFILSSSKHNSQQLFQEMIDQGLQETYTIIAENITGGTGKNIFHATSTKKTVIALGGYNFFLSLVAKKFAFGAIYLYHLFGSMKKQIVTDLLRYSP